LLFVASTSYAQSSSNETEIVLLSSPDVSTATVFPSSAERRFASGELIDLVVGITNHGHKQFNVTSIVASLRYPVDWKVHIQNFTKQVYDVVVNPAETTSFLYSFVPDGMLEPREFGVTANVYYEDEEGGNFTTVFFNSTIHLVEANEALDVQTLFTYVGIVGVVGLIAFIGFNYLKSATKKQRRAPRVETGTQKNDAIDNDWLEGTAAAQKSPKGRKVKKNN